MSKITTDEILGAKAFLHVFGINNPSTYLIRAVVAWYRQESGTMPKIIGNNPFNIKVGAASKLSTGNRPGGFLTFPDLKTGFAAPAVVIKGLSPRYGYADVVTALYNRSALEFLSALAKSGWSETHYGWTPGTNARSATHNHLVKLYAELTV